MANRTVTIEYKAGTKELLAVEKLLEKQSNKIVDVKVKPKLDGSFDVDSIQKQIQKELQAKPEASYYKMTLDIDDFRSQLETAKKDALKTVEEVESELTSASASRTVETLRKNYIGKKSFKGAAAGAQEDAIKYLQGATDALSKVEIDPFSEASSKKVYAYIKALQEYKSVLLDVEAMASDRGFSMDSVGLENFDNILSDIEAKIRTTSENAYNLIHKFGESKSASLPPIIEEIEKAFSDIPVLLSGRGDIWGQFIAGSKEASAALGELIKNMDSAQLAAAGLVTTDQFDELVAKLEKAEAALEELKKAYADLEKEKERSDDYGTAKFNENLDLSTQLDKARDNITSLQSEVADLKSQLETSVPVEKYVQLSDTISELIAKLEHYKQLSETLSSQMRSVPDTSTVPQPKESTDNVPAEQADLSSLATKVREVTQAVELKTEAFKREAETVNRSVSAEINSLGQLKDTIDKISSSISKLYSKRGGKNGSPFTDLVSGLKKLSGISPDVLDKVESVSSAIGVLKNVEFTKAKGNSIGEGLKSISAGIDYEQLNKINDINFSGLLPLNQIRVNANAFQNLANGLSALSGANVDLGLIDKLSGIDFSGLNGLNGIKQATDSSIALSKNFINSQQSRIDAAITRARNAGVDESELAELKNASTVLRQTFNAANVGNLDINTAMQQEVTSIDAAVNKMDLLIDRKQQEAAAQTSINADLNQYNTMLHERDKLVDKMKTRNGWDNQDVTRMQQLFQSMQDMQTKYRGDSSFSNLFALGDAQEKDIKAVYSSVLDEMAVKIQTIKTKFNDSGVQEGSAYKQMADDMQHVLNLKSRFETSDLFNASEAKESFTYMQRITNQAKDLSSALANEQKISKYLKSVSKYDGKSANDFTSSEDYNKIVDKLKQIQTISQNGVFSDADVDKVKTLANEIDEIGNSLIEVKNKSGTIIGNITGKTNTKEAINQLKSMLTAQVESEGNKIEFGSVKGDYDALEYNVITKSGDLQKYTASIDSATGAVRSLMRSESEYVSQGQKFINSITGKFAELTRYMSVMDVVQKGLQFVKSGLSSVIEINTAMTELKKVTDETNQTYDTFQQTAGNVAKTLGSSTTDVISATGDYARLGHTLKESTELAKSSVVLKNVSEYENIDDATSALTAMTQAYRNMDSMDITDKLNNIGNNYSISTEELATGLQKASSVLSLMGNSFDESAALITAGNATLQDVNSVAAGLRTISLRIVGTEEAKKELEDLGEDVSDYVVQTSAKQRQAILDYTAVASNGGKGFDILDANGNYKNTYEILKGIADIYAEIQAEDKKFGTNRASALVELLAGKNRSAIASSILSNPEMLANVKESSANSEGSAMAENSKYLESIQGHIDILRSSFQNLWADTINPAVPNFFLTLGTNILDVVDKVGLLKTGILAITAIGSFKGAGRANLYSCPSKLKMPADILFAA